MSDESKLVERIWVNPSFSDDSACSDDGSDVYHLTYAIPGASKDNIRLRVLNDRVRLDAARGDDAEYASEISFCCDADPSRVSARYEEGLLQVDVPVNCPDPYSDATDVPIE
ncbi:MAG TPA: Hsp20 family protein [Candidatus Lokiarchaeia archaeon]|nr:Hsp20 family protein [Candidatus Lokiarchaeia archaeon]